MNQPKFDTFLWYHNPPHDKYWGWIIYNKVYYNFWGKRDSDITFKRFTSINSSPPRILSSRKNKKIRNGYIDYSSSFDEIRDKFEDFLNKFEYQLTLAKLSDNFHHGKG